MTSVNKLWDLIETWGFREDIKDIVAVDDEDDDDNDDCDSDNNHKEADNDKDYNNYKGISALGLDSGLVFSQGHH